MDLGFSEDQEMIKKSAREFLEKECPADLVREMEEDEKGYSTEMWNKMAELGWMGIPFAEEYGGTEGTFLDLIILIEEMGRVLLPGPFIPTVVSSGLSVLRYGNEAQKREILPKVSSGEFILTFALTEQKASFDVQGIETKAEKTKEGFSLTGTKRFVPDAHVADKILCVAKIEAEEAKVEEGITVFICDLPSEGIEITPLKTLAGDKQCEVVFRDVQVPQENILGEVGKGWEIVEQVKERTIVAICALMAGAARTVVDMSVDYAKQRVQFNRHIGSFQAIQQKCVDMLIATEAAQYLMYQAAWKLDNNLPARQEISMAKAWASDMFREKVWMEGIRVHGGLGLTIDHDIPLYYLRGKAWELMLGDGDYHWNIVADEMKL